MAFEPPLPGLETVIHEPRGEHVDIRHDAQELGMVSKLHVVVRGRSCRASEPIRGIGERCAYLVAHLSSEALEYGRIVD